MVLSAKTSQAFGQQVDGQESERWRLSLAVLLVLWLKLWLEEAS